MSKELEIGDVVRVNRNGESVTLMIHKLFDVTAKMGYGRRDGLLFTVSSYEDGFEFVAPASIFNSIEEAEDFAKVLNRLDAYNSVVNRLKGTNEEASGVTCANGDCAPGGNCVSAI